MELHQFIETALMEVMQGISKADRSIAGAYGEDAGVVDPSELIRLTHAREPDGFQRLSDGRVAALVELDIAVSAGSLLAAKAGAALVVASLGVGKHVTGDDARISRVRFQVPLVMPSRGARNS